MGKLAKILGSISPLAGAITGQGLFGSGLAKMGDAMGPMSGLMPLMAQSARDKRLAEAAAAAEEEAKAKAAMGMKRGGKVKGYAKGGSTASKRADGCAQRGKTRGKMV